MTTFSFSLRLGTEHLTLSGSVPAGECSLTEIMPVLLELGEELIAAAVRQSAEARAVSCGPGCGACCRQLVPVSLSEGIYLREMVLPGLPDEQRERVETRIAAARAILKESPLLNDMKNLPQEHDPAQRRAVGLRYFLQGIPCPFLENESCGIHPQRPLACREYLVTSPASCCAHPNPASIKMVPLPLKPSRLMIKLDAAHGEGPGWRTMVDALLDEAPMTSRTVSDPLRFLQEFLQQLAGEG